MKKLVFPILGVLILGFSGCNKPGDNIQSLELPAIVGVSWETFQPTMITSMGTFVAPELQSLLYTELYEGDAIWAYFSVNYDQPTASGEYVAYDITPFKVETGWAQPTAGGESMSGDYDIPIAELGVADLLQNRMFIVCQHTSMPADQKFLYEMTYDSDETSVPELCIRAKKDYTAGTGTVGTVNFPYAFNMYSFFMTYKDANNMVKFKMKYKIGVDDDGKDRYEYYLQGTVFEIEVE